MFKISSGETSNEEVDMAYLTKRFQKIVRKHEGFRKGGNLLRTENSSGICYKCEKDGHLTIGCPMTKA